MKTWDDFYPHLLPDVPKAPYPLVDQALRDACIEFCEKTKSLVSTLALVDAVADQQRYVLPMADDTELVEVLNVWFSGEKLDPASRSFLDRKFEDWTAEVGDPGYFLSEDTESVLLVPAPGGAEDDAIKVKAAIKPGIEATGIDDWLFSAHRIDLVAGAKAALMSMPNRPWTDPDRAAGYRAKFDASIAAAIGEANSGMVRSRPRFSGSFC